MTEAEQGVIGCVLIDNDSMYKVYNKLKPEMFNTEFCQDAFAEMLAMYDRGENINVVSLSQALENHKWEPEIIAGEIKECVTATPVSTAMKSYADAVVKDWRARETKNLFQRVSLRPCDIDNSIAEVLTRLEEIQVNQLKKSKLMKQIVSENKDKYFNDDVGEERVKTGFYRLDDCLGGLEGGDITVVAARPGVGKSAIVAQIIENMARKGYNTCYYNMEMNNSQIYERFVSRMSKIGLTRIRRAKSFLGGEKEAFDKANDELENYLLDMERDPALQKIARLCDNTVLNVILVHHASICKSLGIDVDFDIRQHSVDFISAHDITAIFDNLLTNAEEAAKNTSEKYIKLSAMRQGETGMLITIINSCDSAPDMDEDGNIKTKKEDKEHHGVGLKSVRQAVKRYQGVMRMYYNETERRFHCVIRLINSI